MARLPRLLLALALLLAPLSPRPMPLPLVAGGIPICTADGGIRHLPAPDAPSDSRHCEACLAAAPALPPAPAGLQPPAAAAFAWSTPVFSALAPPDTPAARARAPPAA